MPETMLCGSSPHPLTPAPEARSQNAPEARSLSILYQLQSSRDPNCKALYPPHVHDQLDGYIKH